MPILASCGSCLASRSRALVGRVVDDVQRSPRLLGRRRRCGQEHLPPQVAVTRNQTTAKRNTCITDLPQPLAIEEYILSSSQHDMLASPTNNDRAKKIAARILRITRRVDTFQRRVFAIVLTRRRRPSMQHATAAASPTAPTSPAREPDNAHVVDVHIERLIVRLVEEELETRGEMSSEPPGLVQRFG